LGGVSGSLDSGHCRSDPDPRGRRGHPGLALGASESQEYRGGSRSVRKRILLPDRGCSPQLLQRHDSLRHDCGHPFLHYSQCLRQAAPIQEVGCPVSGPAPRTLLNRSPNRTQLFQRTSIRRLLVHELPKARRLSGAARVACRAVARMPPNKALQRTINSSVQLTLVAARRHTSEAGSRPVSAVAGRWTPIRSASRFVV